MFGDGSIRSIANIIHMAIRNLHYGLSDDILRGSGIIISRSIHQNKRTFKGIAYKSPNLRAEILLGTTSRSCVFVKGASSIPTSILQAFHSVVISAFRLNVGESRLLFLCWYCTVFGGKFEIEIYVLQGLSHVLRFFSSLQSWGGRPTMAGRAAPGSAQRDGSSFEAEETLFPNTIIIILITTPVKYLWYNVHSLLEYMMGNPTIAISKSASPSSLYLVYFNRCNNVKFRVDWTIDRRQVLLCF